MIERDEKWLIEYEKRLLEQDKYITEVKKQKFIEEMKNGLLDDIKKEPNKIQKKPSIFQKLKRIFS